MSADPALIDRVELHINDLCDRLSTYLDPAFVEEVRRAFEFGARAHHGQRRLTGDPYIVHPVAVAKILAGMRLDHKTIIAALLHDVIEDTKVTKEEVAEAFDDEVAELVDGVTKLTQIKFQNPAEEQAENFRKMMLAMVRDIRVIMVKLADRLHNMRTLEVMRPAKRRRIARETLEIYVPIANRLGLNALRIELEDLGFAAHYPLRYRILKEAIKRARGNRKEIMGKIEETLATRMEQEGLPGVVLGREKHLYSIFKKMRTKSLSFNEVQDVYAFRIIVDSVDACYRALGLTHNLYKPVPGRFKDYIAIPKANGYQSLHTVLVGPYDLPIEVQIRTEDMHKVAETGIAAHWAYKSGTDDANSAKARAHEWLRNLLEMQKSAGNSLEFLENVKIDLFPHEVYVFTPKGKIMVLPRKATPVDFAYAVHTDIGNTCVAAKVDRHLAPLRTQLTNGQTVEIITTPVARPNPSWLNFVVTAKARTNVLNYLKHLKREDAISLGRHMFSAALDAMDHQLEVVTKSDLDRLLDNMHKESLEVLYEDIGLGRLMAPLVAHRLLTLMGVAPSQEPTGGEGKPVTIKGTESLVVTFPKCCRPIPGDPILGFVTAGRGIVVHTETCPNVAEYRDKPDKWIDLEWEKETEGEFTVEIRAEVINERGVLASIAAQIAELGSNIENVNMEERDGVHTNIVLTITVQNRKHLARIMRRLRSEPRVMRIYRLKI